MNRMVLTRKQGKQSIRQWQRSVAACLAVLLFINICLPANVVYAIEDGTADSEPTQTVQESDAAADAGADTVDAADTVSEDGTGDDLGSDVTDDATQAAADPEQTDEADANANASDPAAGQGDDTDADASATDDMDADAIATDDTDPEDPEQDSEQASEQADDTGADAAQADESETQLPSLLTQADVEDANEILYTGTCGTDANWTLTAGGVLTISGTGAMDDYLEVEYVDHGPSSVRVTNSTEPPWEDYADSITQVVVCKGITSIGNGAFAYLTNLTDVTIADGVTEIGDMAFSDCTSLTTINIPASVTDLGAYALAYTGLTSFELPKTIETYGNGVFAYSELKSVTLPANMTEIPAEIFMGCENLTGELTLEGVVSVGDGAFYDTGITAVTIPSSVKKLGGSAFGGTKITSLVIPDTVEEIGESLISECEALTSVTLPSNMTKIGAYFFAFCTSLQTIELPAGITEIGEGAFEGCGFTTFTVPEGVTTLAASTFSYCTNLTEVILPSTLENIETSAFAGCTSLKRVTVPGTLSEVGNWVFQNCTSLTEIGIGKSDETVTQDKLDKGPTFSTYMFGYGQAASTIQKIVITKEANLVSSSFIEAVQELDASELSVEGPNTFTYSGDAITMGNLPLSEGEYYVTQSGVLYRLNTDEKTGAKTATLEHVPGEVQVTSFVDVASAAALGMTYDATNEGYTITDTNGKTYTVTALGDFAFMGHTELTGVTIPSCITSIGDRTFENCTALASVTIEGSTTLSGDAAENLEAVVAATKDYGASLSTYRNTKLADGKLTIDPGTLQTGDLALTSTEDGNRYALTLSLAYESDHNHDGYIPNSTTSSESTESGESATNKAKTLLTGQTAYLNIKLSDVSAGSIQDTLRVYFRADEGCSIFDNGKIFGHAADTTLNFKDTDGNMVLGRFHATADNECYFEVLHINSGATFSLNLSASYPTKSSGGTMQVWLDKTKGTVMPTQVAQVDWITINADLELSKTPGDAGDVLILGDGTENSGVYVNGLAYTVAVTRKSSTVPSDGCGADYVKQYTFTDTLTLPDGFSWNAEVIKAIQGGRYLYYGNTFYAILNEDYDRRQVDSNMYYFFQLDRVEIGTVTTSGTNVTRTTDTEATIQVVTVDGKDEIQITLVYTNKSATDEISVTGFKITYGSAYTWSQSKAIVADTSKLTTDGSGTAYADFKNTVNLDVAYWQSNTTETYTNEATLRKSLKAELTFTKDTEYGSNGAKMGSSETFKLTLANNSPLQYGGITKVTDALPSWFYITPSQMAKMFNDTYGKGLTISIAEATLCTAQQKSVTYWSGRQTTLDQSMIGTNTRHDGLVTANTTDADSCKITNQAAITLQWEGDALNMTVTVPNDAETIAAMEKLTAWNNGAVTSSTTTDTVSKVYTISGDSSISDALSKLGFVVTNTTTYSCVWALGDENGIALASGQSLKIDLYATTKSTPMMLTSDTRYSYNGKASLTSVTAGSSTNAAYYYTTASATTYAGRAAKTLTIRPEMLITKTAYLDGSKLTSKSNITAGAVIKYIDAPTFSSSVTPMVDKMSGGQVLLVPVEKNDALKDMNLDTMTYNDADYYILSKPGTYTNVTVGGGKADTIEVTSDGTSGTETLIYWYLTSSNVNVTYYALADPKTAKLTSLNTDDGSSFSLKNEVWLGDHETHRVYDVVTIPGTVLSSSKAIVTNAESTITASHDPAADTLTAFSFIEKGQQVTYRLTTLVDSDTAVTLSGDELMDALPVSLNSFWQKGTNVSLTFVPAQGAKVTYTGDKDGWSIALKSSNKSDTTETYQKIVWDNTFQITLKGTLYIYVTLTYPTGDDWTAYCKHFGADTLTNTWTVRSMSTSVTHMLAEISEGVMIKSVLGTGTEQTSYSRSPLSYNTNSDGCWYYSNKMNSNSLVSYSITIYNSGVTRLYLTEVEDMLPKGFTFYSMYCTDSGIALSKAYYGNGLNIMSSDERSKIKGKISITDEEHSTVTVKEYTAVYASVGETGADGRQPLTFTFASNYDPENPSVWLDPGESITFAYNCLTNGYEDTEDAAENLAVMRLYDYTGKGVAMKDSGVTIASVHGEGVEPNDGECTMVNAAQVEMWGMDATYAGADGQYLASAVTVYRGSIVPGISKVAGSNTNPVKSVTSTETITWTVTAMNDGNGNLYDYTLTDVMMTPYQFTGEVNYSIRSSSGGTLVSERTLFTITKTNGTTVTLKDQNDTVRWLVIGGESLTLYSYAFGYFEVRMDRNEAGDAILSIHFSSQSAALAAGGCGVLTLQTVNTSDNYENKSFINECYLTPNAQTFNSGSVLHGSYLLFDVPGDTEDAVPSVKSQAQVMVTYGYATVAEKTVTELDEEGAKTGNTATSSGSTNSITLAQGADSTFRYTLQMHSIGSTTGTVQDKGMTLFVLVDNLPEVGDHLTMYTRYSRGSEFKVDFADLDELNAVVTVTANNKTTTLEASQYELLFSAQTDLDYDTNKQLWEGATLTEASGWYTWEQCVQRNNWHEMRSVRLVIKDENASGLLPANAVVEFSFNAKVCGDGGIPVSSQVAWNSFGYLYRMEGDNRLLRAATQIVGVKMPSAPTITKELVDYTGSAYEAEADETFTFLLYEGTSQGLDASEEVQTLLEELGERDIPATLITLTVPKGASKSETLTLENLHPYEKGSDGAWAASETDWKWTTGTKYTILELTGQNSSEYNFLSLNGSRKNLWTFTYLAASQQSILAINQRISWTLSVTKRSAEDGSPLAGATFALYTNDETQAITTEETYEGIAVRIEAPSKTDADSENTGGTETVDEGQGGSDAAGDETETQTENRTWYLMAVDTTDQNGRVRWNGLTASEEYLMEVVAPEGYLLAEGRVIEATWSSLNAVTVFDQIDPEYHYLTVNKVWEDSGYESERPESVTVTLRKNGVAVDQQQLSEANEWTYTWTGLTPTAQWTVTEDDVPSGYSAATTVDGRTVTITNTRKDALTLPTVLLVGIPWLIEKLSQLLMDPTPLGDLSLTDPVSTPDEAPEKAEETGPVYQLPQTGLNRLPVWILLGAGVALLAVGLYLNRKDRKGKQNPGREDKTDRKDPKPQDKDKQNEDPQDKP